MSEAHTREVITVSADAYGRAIKVVIEQLQAHHSTDTFGYDDLPWWDAAVVSAVGEPDSRWVNSKILRDTNNAGLTETVGYEEFQLTDKGRYASVHVVGEG